MPSTIQAGGNAAPYGANAPAPIPAARSGAGDATSAGPSTGTGLREIQEIIYRFRRDGDAAAVYGSRSTAGHPPAREAVFQAIQHQLKAICAQEHAQQWKPVPGVAETLDLVAHYVKGASDVETQGLDAMLNDILAQAISATPVNEAVATHRVRDILLLSIALQRVQEGEDPRDFLAGFAEDNLELGNFRIRGEGLEEPSSRQFDSTLPVFAGATYRFGPLGRTLMLEGARACFAGPRQAQRGDKLRDIIFALPYPPESGPPLEYDCDRFAALLEMGFDL